MNTHTDIGRAQSAATSAVDIRENDGIALRRNPLDHHYGRRIEADRSWTVYHVFTGVPARDGGDAMTGLSRVAATDTMLSMNHRNDARRPVGGGQIAGIPKAPTASRECLL